ncbi:MAG: HAD family phosphatase [Bacteroidales bacterium]|nr:HAD family phosphatase [Bacteroidales bacterium]
MIKNLIFDLGGVIYDIRYQNVPESFAKYGIPNFEQYYTKAAQSDAIDLLEEGKISPAEFRSFIRSISPVSLTDQQIDDAWNSIMVDIPEKRINMLKELKSKYSVYLFSNTNQLNYDEFTVRMREKYGYDIFTDLFVKAYFSHQIHIKKPLPESFQFIINEQHLNPAETLFIDDTLRHVEGARKVGLNAYHLQDGEDVVDKKWMEAYHLLP